jgi:hypothetical protein
MNELKLENIRLKQHILSLQSQLLKHDHDVLEQQAQIIMKELQNVSQTKTE